MHILSGYEGCIKTLAPFASEASSLAVSSVEESPEHQKKPGTVGVWREEFPKRGDGSCSGFYVRIHEVKSEESSCRFGVLCKK